MDQQVSDVRTEQWRRIVCECLSRDPEISKKQWCRENSIRYRSLMYWQHKFQQEALAMIDDDHHQDVQPALPVHSVPASVPAFADMTAKLEALQTEHVAVSPEPEDAAFTPELMILAGSYRIYVNDSIHEATLMKVMSVIGHA